LGYKGKRNKDEDVVDTRFLRKLGEATSQEITVDKEYKKRK
jgi:hypothetical protein